MSQDISFRRKIIYVAAIALLLFPLFLLGQPATTRSSGGVLAQLRTKYNLSQSDLGQIDPASEAMKLATMGLRPVAVITLWEKSNEFKMKEDWDNLSATLNQIIKLQPNYITVWEFQAHNLAYNVSVEFDDYRQRYHWVKKGISFLTEGTRYNRENPRLLHQIGWITGQKIGRADEHVQFRQMFRQDDDFHREINEEVFVDEALGYDGRPDHWLVGRLWYERAQSAVDTKGIPLRGKSPLIFHSDNPMSYINYAGAIEDEGVLGETAMRAWRVGSEGWAEYGQRQIPTSWGHNIRLADYERTNDEAEAMIRTLDEMLPGLRDQVKQEKRDRLTPEQRAALDTPVEQLSDENYELWLEAQRETQITHREVAERAVDRELRERAVKLAGRIEDAQLLASRTAQYRGIVNYEYWQTRSEAEQTRTAVDAREYLYNARRLQDEASLEDARELYEKSWQQWRKLYDQFPPLMDDVAADDLVRAIQRYARLLQQLDEPLPDDFPLYDFLQRHESNLDDFLRQALQQRSDASSTAPPAPEETPDDAPEMEEPETEKPDAAKPADEEAPADKPAAEESDDEMPDTEKPEAEEPKVEKPEAEEPAAEEPPAEPSETEEPEMDEAPEEESETTKPEPEPGTGEGQPEAAR
jgi:hypothetical protein